ncbi:MAG TPA: hypothetical protein VJM57_08930 [Thermodesulfobacteriota bacterium]|nr:hypothetical protein [Thermodesulfobacteriota bacterium]
MAVTLSKKYLDELRRANTPNVVLEVELDGGLRLFGYHARNASPMTRFLADGSYHADGSVFAVGSDELPGVLPLLESVSSLQNKLDTEKGFSTRGELKVVITGRENLRDLVRDEFLKNRRVTRKDGFISRGFTYADYAATYTGVISNWSRKGDELTITVSDELVDASKKIPEENESNTQHIDYRDTHPVDIMKDIILNRLEVDPAHVDTDKFDEEKSLWLQGWRFSRVITEPEEANKYLNELQRETNSFIIHDGEKVSCKVFAPPAPVESVQGWSDEKDILEDSLAQRSGYKEHFFNRVVVYFDYDESGSDDEENFEAAVISVDASSQDSSRWDETSTKTIKSKWIKSRTFSQPVNVTGVTVYHCSKNNGPGTGTLSFTYDAGGEHTLEWTPPGGTPGEAVAVSRDGKFDVYSTDESKFLRLIVETGYLPSANGTDAITISALNGQGLATTLANKILSRYRDPASTVSFEVDINNVVFNSRFIKPTDLKDLTTDEAFSKGSGTWSSERVMLTSVRPDFSAHKVKVEAVQTKMYRKYGFVAPAGRPDYPSATDKEKEYGYIGDEDNKLNNGTANGDYVW